MSMHTRLHKEVCVLLACGLVSLCGGGLAYGADSTKPDCTYRPIEMSKEEYNQWLKVHCSEGAQDAERQPVARPQDQRHVSFPLLTPPLVETEEEQVPEEHKSFQGYGAVGAFASGARGGLFSRSGGFFTEIGMIAHRKGTSSDYVGKIQLAIAPNAFLNYVDLGLVPHDQGLGFEGFLISKSTPLTQQFRLLPALVHRTKEHRVRGTVEITSTCDSVAHVCGWGFASEVSGEQNLFENILTLNASVRGAVVLANSSVSSSYTPIVNLSTAAGAKVRFGKYFYVKAEGEVEHLRYSELGLISDSEGKLSNNVGHTEGTAVTGYALVGAGF